MSSRREFLRNTAAVPALRIGASNLSAIVAQNGTQPPSMPEVPAMDNLRPRGQTYEATIPDTLDLAERARLSVNNLTHNVDPDDYYYNYQVIRFGSKKPGPDLHSRTWNLTPKNLRALPWMRTMCGSEDFLDLQFGMMKALLSNVRADGLLYYPADSDGPPKNTSYPDVNGILALACEIQHTMDGDRRWLDWIDLLGSGLRKVAIRVQDRAYFPPESSIDPDGRWHWNLRGIATLPYNPPEEPYLEQQGLEGCVKFEQAYAIRALVRAWKNRPNADDQELLKGLLRFCLKPGMWELTGLEDYLGNEHGIFSGHFHGNTAALLGLLDVAEAQKHTWLKEFVRQGYENAIRNGAPRIGWFPGWAQPTKYGRPAAYVIATEGDTIAEMIELAVRLSDAGLGDYWDHADSMARNQLIEQQICSRKMMRQMSGGTAGIDRFVGGFTQIFTNPPHFAAAPPEMYGCCSANGSIGLYYAWHGITRFQDGVATVNMFLNRASSWMDVDSYLPYKGRVDLHNKQARTALVRIPNWVEPEDMKCTIDSAVTHPPRSGRYLVFDSLRPGSNIRLEFPNPESTDSYLIAGRRFRVTFRGNTIVDIDPKPETPGTVQLYQRQMYKATQAPVRVAKRFAADKILPLQ